MSENPSFSSIINFNNLLLAHKKSLRGKRNSYRAACYNYYLISNLLKLHYKLKTGTYYPDHYYKKIIYEPKKRLIEAPCYHDLIVQHAINNSLSDFYERFFIPGSFACRKGRGTHAAAHYIQQILRRTNVKYACHMDISKYYASINHRRLYEIIKSKINDDKIMSLLWHIIQSSDSGHKYDNILPSDAPYFHNGHRGIPIGNLTSQLFANIYLNELDMYVKQKLKIRYYARYMDDIIFFDNSKLVIKNWQTAITEFCHDNLYLTINPHKNQVYPTDRGVDFVGFIIFPYFMRLRGSSVRRYTKRFRKNLKLVIHHKKPLSDFDRSFTAWKGYAKQANTGRLISKLENQKDATLNNR